MDDDIITLTSANGEDIDFREIAGVAFEGNFYVILQPVELFEGMDDNDVFVFRVSYGPDGDDNFQVISDDRIIENVLNQYNKMLEEQG